MSNRFLKLAGLALVPIVITACGGSPTQPSAVTVSRTLPTLGSKPAAPSRPLLYTKFMAFGDSQTAGTITMANGLLGLVASSAAYPGDLQNILQSDFPGQRITVFNEGQPDETAVDGESRFPGTLQSDNPQVVLLLEGVNDLNENGAAGESDALAALSSMIGDAQAAGDKVLVGTLLPQVPGGQRAYAVDLIQPFNVQLTQMVASHGAVLVDLYDTFAADLSLIGPDGLHPTALGYAKMAQLWADKIESLYQEPLPSPVTPQ
jgi:lysophospholipase L1-like esterase